MKVRGIRMTVPNMRMVLGMRGHEPSRFNRCVGGKLFGGRPGTQPAAQEAFKRAVGECRGTRGS